MHERSRRRRKARGAITNGVVHHTEDVPHDALWRDAEDLVAIARRHAALALASPAEARASQLDACRTVWIHYAAAFSASPTIQARFADELQDATRALMAEEPESDAAPPEPKTEQPPAEPRPVWSPKVPASPITLEELRLILSQIIRQ